MSNCLIAWRTTYKESKKTGRAPGNFSRTAQPLHDLDFWYYWVEHVLRFKFTQQCQCQKNKIR